MTENIGKGGWTPRKTGRERDKPGKSRLSPLGKSQKKARNIRRNGNRNIGEAASELIVDVKKQSHEETHKKRKGP